MRRLISFENYGGSVSNPPKNFLSTLVKDFWGFIRRHPITVGILVLLCIAYLIFSVMIGFAPMVVLLAPVALFVLFMLRRRFSAQKDGGRSEVLATISYVAIGSVLTFALIQLVPYGKSQTPFVSSTAGEMKWDSPRTRELTMNACYGCHSDQIEYPSYASVAPISWAVQHHIDEGRSELNFSTFTTNSHGFDDMVEVIQDGSMPPSYYTAFGKHPEARLSDSEIAELVAGLKATMALNGITEKSEGKYGDDND